MKNTSTTDQLYLALLLGHLEITTLKAGWNNKNRNREKWCIFKSTAPLRHSQWSEGTWQPLLWSKNQFLCELPYSSGKKPPELQRQKPVWCQRCSLPAQDDRKLPLILAGSCSNVPSILPAGSAQAGSAQCHPTAQHCPLLGTAWPRNGRTPPPKLLHHP